MFFYCFCIDCYLPRAKLKTPRDLISTRSFSFLLFSVKEKRTESSSLKYRLNLTKHLISSNFTHFWLVFILRHLPRWHDKTNRKPRVAAKVRTARRRRGLVPRDTRLTWLRTYPILPESPFFLTTSSESLSGRFQGCFGHSKFFFYLKKLRTPQMI